VDHANARRHSRNRTRELRSRVANEAARIMTEHGVRDFGLAKRRAAERLGVHDEGSLPKNSEIEEALREYQRLFKADTQPVLLRERRATAAEAMRFFFRFEPRLVGAVLEGIADEYSAVCLHLFSDDPAAVQRFLDENGIPHDEQTRRVRIDAARTADYPVYTFSADGTPMDLTVMPLDGLRQAPLDRVDGQPMRRASLKAVEDLLKGAGGA
jgi:hypothetical protein